jgi:hypothetical protein
LDHLVKEPTLLAPAAHFSFGLQSHGHSSTPDLLS